MFGKKFRRKLRILNQILEEAGLDHTSTTKYIMYNRDNVLKSELCVCLSCLEVFPPSEITDWCDPIDDTENSLEITPLCPRCGIDDVLGTESDIPIDVKYLIQSMR